MFADFAKDPLEAICGRAQEQAPVRLYDRLAPSYDRHHRRWLRHAGGEAQAALEGAARALLRPDKAMLDAGCGTGLFARRLINEGIAPRHMTLLDASKAMLARSADLPVRRTLAQLERLPFNDASFDLVVCAWALETTRCIEKVVAELCRVVRPNGHILLCFCADLPVSGLRDWAMRSTVELRRAGRFLKPDDVSRAFGRQKSFRLRLLPCKGPAIALLAQCAVK